MSEPIKTAVEAQRLAVYVQAFSIDGAVNVPVDQRRVKLSKFMDAAGELDHAHKKQEEIHQRELPTKGYWHEGIRRAKEVLAGTRPPPTEF